MLINNFIIKNGYKDKISVLTVDELTLFPALYKDTNLNILYKISNMIGNEVDMDKIFNKTYLRGTLISNNLYIEEYHNFLPVKIVVRNYLGNYTIETKDNVYNLNSNIITNWLNDPLVYKKDLSNDFSLFINLVNKIKRKGKYYQFSLPSKYLLDLISEDDLKKLDVDKDNFRYIYMYIPKTLLSVVNNLNNISYLISTEAYEDTWVYLISLLQILNININNVKSHIVRKFLTYIKREMDNIYGTNQEHFTRLIASYISRVWTDELKEALLTEYPNIILPDINDKTYFKKVICMFKKDNLVVNNNVGELKYILDTIKLKLRNINGL